MAEFAILVLLFLCLCKFMSWYFGPTRLHVLPQEFLAIVEAAPPPVIVVHDTPLWSSEHTYTYRDAAHIVSTASVTPLHFPANVACVASPQTWLPGL